MNRMRTIQAFLLLGCILISCKNQEVELDLQKESPNYQSLSEISNVVEDKNFSNGDDVVEDKNFSYGDELTFYLKDEKLSENPSAISVVNKFLQSMKINDYDTWLSLLTSEKQKGFSREINGDFGVISFDILNICYETDIRYKQMILTCKKAVDMGLTPDNIAVIYVHYNATYDHTKVPSNDGEIKWHYTLIRSNNNSPWLIQGWGYGYGGI